MILTGMTLNQAIHLEQTFAKLNADGQWVLPLWLVQLQRDLAERDLAAASEESLIPRIALENHEASRSNNPSREG